MLEKIAPHSLEAEEQILGSLILDANLIHSIALNEDDFYSLKHRTLFKSIVQLIADRVPVEFISLRERGQDPRFISTLVNSVVSTANVQYHTDLVKEYANRRKIRVACMQALQDIQAESVDMVMAGLRNSLSNIARDRGKTIVTSRELAVEVGQFLDRRAENRDALSGVPSGFNMLDRLTDGWQGGDLIIVAARPGQGKSALAMIFSENALVPVGIISIEMGAHQLGIRTLATLSQVDLWRLRKGVLDKNNWADVGRGLSKFAELPLYFSFLAKNSTEIERTITQMVQAYECKMIVVDYLQLTKGTHGKKREEEVAEISRLLKIMAQTHNIPIIAISQLNREVEKRENRRPILSDLRESGAIEQDADIVIFLYKEGKEGEDVLNVDIAKGRNIGLGRIRLHFNGDTMTFSEIDKEEY